MREERIPKSVLIAIFALALMLITQLVTGVIWNIAISFLLPLIGIEILILIGILKRQRLAWQWGRLLGILSMISLLGAVIGHVICMSDQEVSVYLEDICYI